MKIPPPIVAVLAWIVSLSPAYTQNPTMDGFESCTVGPLNGQNGWSGLSIGGTSAVNVSNSLSFSGIQSMYVYDGDTANRPKARYDYGANFANDRFSVAVSEAPNTSGRDYWRMDFYNSGSGTVNFSLVLVNATTLTLSGAGGTAVSVNPTTTSYDPNGWNTFTIRFNNTTKQAWVYLNGESVPILTNTSTGINWSMGRVELSVGWTAATDQRAYYDSYDGQAEWQTTNKLRYAPPTLVAPKTITITSVNFTSLVPPVDQDVIVKFNTAGPIRKNVQIKGGRNVRILGGHFGAGSLLTGGSGATGGPRKSIFIEGVKMDKTVGMPDGTNLSTMNGYKVDPMYKGTTDCFHIGGVDAGSAVAPDVYVQNCLITGIHSTNQRHDFGIQTQVLSAYYNGNGQWQGTAFTKQFIIVAQGTTLATQLVATNNNKYNSNFILGATTNSFINHTFTRYTGSLTVNVNGTPVATTNGLATLNGNTVIAAYLTDAWACAAPSATGALSLGSGSSGYIWPEKTAAGTIGNLDLTHSDGYQTNQSTITENVRFYRVTFAGGYQAFIGGDMGTPDTGCRSLSMSNVNMRQEQIWPQDDNAVTILLKGEVPPVTLNNVHVQPRPSPLTLISGLLAYPGSAQTPPTMNAAGTAAHWLTVPQITDEDSGGPGLIYKSANGAGHLGGDYVLGGTSTPGGQLSYVSPGYSSDALQPLVLNAITIAPLAGTLSGSTLTVPASAVSAANAPVIRNDVTFQNAGYIIDLSLTNDANGKFKMDLGTLATSDPRNIVTTGAVAAGTYTVTVKASENGNSSNSITKNITIVVQ